MANAFVGYWIVPAVTLLFARRGDRRHSTLAPAPRD